MNNIIRFVKTSGIYFLGNILTKMISFLLIPLYSNKILAEDFGYYDLSISIINLVIPLVFFQVWDGVFRFIFDYKEKSDKEKIISNGIVITFIGFLMFTILFVICRSIFNFKFAFLIYLNGVLTAVQFYYSIIARGYMRNTLFVVSGVVNSTVNIIMNILLISVFDLGVKSLYIATIFGIIVQMIIIELSLKPLKEFKLKYYSKEIVIDIIKFSLPIGISTISYWLLSGLTRIVISRYLGMESNGIYAMTNRFCSVIVLATSVIQFSWNELSYILASEGNKDNILQQGINYILKTILLMGAVLLIIMNMFYPSFVAKEYIDGITILPIVLLGTIANSFAGLIGTLFMANKKSNVLFISTIIAAVINVLGLLILVPFLGLIGATLALTIAFIVNSFVRVYILNRDSSITIEIGESVKLVIIVMFSCVVAYLGNIFIQLISLIAIIFYSVWYFRGVIIMIIKKIYALFNRGEV